MIVTRTRETMAALLLLAGKHWNLVRGALSGQFDNGDWFNTARKRAEVEGMKAMEESTE